ncbi:16S rRNA (cytosine(1402)-N(4))-methyltransferase RsmH [Venenivibrio stagnispumantis]|uniref:Ribosomal RNA small subunit methyltransferase H n=1 Tax=Venenivibrio stagnispumantis TaxID=407998 RepID=A0AA45WL05_9AQUI|nr:16S rRNA (cytosine(1402)-N(4))-methyltransferase RsmH [Venenivibrio stagnispumantis]MCW4573123.1 16S rRNA (cytosine(1402)-N(4))-methyltransferase RsmH [Venenivibrio stagnispumantis]SMP08843.1 16S rRNA (cytosine1402-N4)-methyltransferase [Venenivibrio stagnispumantis]
MIEHYPILHKEILEFAKTVEGKIFVDATVGGGGHSYLFLKNFPDKFLIGIDRDDFAIEKAKERLKEFEGRYILIKESFKNLDKVLKSQNIDKASLFLFDLGVSTFQLKMERGFSFQREEFLDMRMDKSQELTAYDVVNYYTEQQLYKIIKDYGEEKFAKCISKKIAWQRKIKKIETTKELADLIVSCYPPKLRYGRIHPATKTFQAIRIVVNDELSQIEEGIKKAIQLIEKNGLIMVISFHSLEDRIVKNLFKSYKELKKIEILTKKPITPTEEEIKENPPSRSAKLRIAREI